jgi:hypothetical protein
MVVRFSSKFFGVAKQKSVRTSTLWTLGPLEFEVSMQMSTLPTDYEGSVTNYINTEVL